MDGLVNESLVISNYSRGGIKKTFWTFFPETHALFWSKVLNIKGVSFKLCVVYKVVNCSEILDFSQNLKQMAKVLGKSSEFRSILSPLAKMALKYTF